jgi:hypothetical protein
VYTLFHLGIPLGDQLVLLLGIIVCSLRERVLVITMCLNKDDHSWFEICPVCFVLRKKKNSSPHLRVFVFPFAGTTGQVLYQKKRDPQTAICQPRVSRNLRTDFRIRAALLKCHF